MNGETEKKSEPGSQLVEKVMPPEPVVAEPTGTPSGDEIAEFEALLTELAEARDPETTVEHLSVEAFRAAFSKGDGS